jgi:hypothetical protein
MNIGFLISILIPLTVVSIALQIMINREQNEVNKQLSKFVDLSIEKFDQIDKALEKMKSERCNETIDE